MERVEVLLTDPGIDVELGEDKIVNSLDWLDANLDMNRGLVGTRASTAKLLWGSPEDLQEIRRAHPPFDLVVGSDLLYQPEQHQSLLETMHELAGSVGVILGYSSRPHTPEVEFLEMVKQASVLRADRSEELESYWDDAIGGFRRVGVTHWRRVGS